MNFTSTLNVTLSALTVIGQVYCLVVLALLLLRKTNNKFMSWVGRRGVLIGAVAALAATMGSLAYSDIIGYNPCKFCWWQRIFMYPQVLLLGLAALPRGMYRRAAAYYGIIFSSIGAIIAFWHYLIQRGVLEAGCPVVGYSVSCAKIFVMNFGYITIPLMAFTAFLMIILSLLVFNKANPA